MVILLDLSILALCLAPFWFNPHQFVFSNFIINYRYVYLCFEAGDLNVDIS